MGDRRVHATIGINAQIVRYDRAGKWYYEEGDIRTLLTISEAVEFVSDKRQWIPGVQGGLAFDRLVRRKLEKIASSKDS